MTLNVIYWGHTDMAPIPYFRGQQFAPYWPEVGITAFYIRHEDIPKAAIDWDPLDWADVVVFRRWYVDGDRTEKAWEHCRATGKPTVYDTDDWDFGTPSVKVPRYREVWAQRPLIERMLREADLVTTATPELAHRYGRLTRKPPVVVRNAADVALYEPDQPRTDDRVTALFYGTYQRLKDYFGSAEPNGKWRGGYAYAAVRDARLPSVWVGDEGVDDQPREFTRIVPYARDVRAFFRTLGNAHADIGVAPLSGDSFDYCKSELHWLDLSAAGVAVVAERLRGENPYRPVRDGVDGLLAHGRQEWADAVGRLARDQKLRTDLVQAARERLVSEYDPRRRAAEWAEVFRSAYGASKAEEVA